MHILFLPFSHYSILPLSHSPTIPFSQYSTRVDSPVVFCRCHYGQNHSYSFPTIFVCGIPINRPHKQLAECPPPLRPRPWPRGAVPPPGWTRRWCRGGAGPRRCHTGSWTHSRSWTGYMHCHIHNKEFGLSLQIHKQQMTKDTLERQSFHCTERSIVTYRHKDS